MIRVLLVEDSDLAVEQVRSWLEASSPACDLVVARDRDTALALLEGGVDDYDLIICDLNIPARVGSLDTSEEYGLQVQALARERYRGTPCLFLTGHADDVDTHDQLSAGGVEDIYGTGDLEPMVKLIRKLYVDRAGEFIAKMSAETKQLDAIELELGTIDLTPFEQRAVRIFIRRHQGSRGELRPMGGLSGAKTFGIKVFDDDQVRRASAFGKISSRAGVEDEERRFQQFVSVHIDPSCLPVLAGHVLSGAGRCAALYYSFADHFDRCFFDVIEDDEDAALRTLGELRVATEPWHNTGMTGEVGIADLRRIGLTDEAMAERAEILDFDWRSIEAVRIHGPIGPQHGDMHGKNILVAESGRVMLIDFGDVERRPLGFDPVVLELSLLFHCDRPRQDSVPSVDICGVWADVERFASGTPYPRLIRACRGWAFEATGDERIVMGLAYAHAVRQLKYSDADKEMAACVAASAAARLAELV